MFIQPTGWLIDLIRQLLAGIDVILYKILSYMIQLIFEIANFNLASSETLRTVYTKIYVVLTVYMLFKLSFTFLNYIVNPEALSDDKQGVNKIIRNSVIMIILLIILPGIFNGNVLGKDGDNVITRIQKAATPIISKILIPKTDNNEPDLMKYNDSEDTSKLMALAIAKIFYHPSYKAYNNVCNGKMPVPIQSIDEIPNSIIDYCPKKKGVEGYDKEKSFYQFSYVYVISTLVTVFFLYLLYKMIVLVGKRTFKILVLEIIFPIPVIMLIDPKAMDDTSSPFRAWAHNFVTTFLELYFQLGAIYLFLQLIKMITEVFIDKEKEFGFVTFDDLLLELALIISLVYFVGEAPVFIKKALGVKREDEPSDDMGNVVAGAASFALATAEKGAKKTASTAYHGVVNTGKSISSTLASGVASKMNGGSFKDGAHAGFKRSIGYNPTKGYKENFKDKLKGTAVGGAFYKAHKYAKARTSGLGGGGGGGSP